MNQPKVIYDQPKVPKIIHQLWIGDKPPPINAMNSIRNNNPDYDYNLWNEELIESKLKIPKRYQRKIENHGPIWGKADMYRFLILEQFGGVFVDADMIAVEPLDDFLLNKAFFCWENEIARPNLCATSLQAYPPHHIIPQTAIDWIMNNNVNVDQVNTPSWELVGPGLLTRVYHTLLPDKSVVNVFPSYYALPDHHSGSKYIGHGKVYMSHEWGSTWNSYQKINEMSIPPHHQRPSNSITIDIPNNVKTKELKEIIKGIKNMEGHFNINIKYEKDLSKYLNSMRFVSHINGELSQRRTSLSQEELLEYNENLVEYPEDLIYYNEKEELINHKVIESTEQRLSEKHIKPEDVVLELGARYGTVSCLVNRIINDKKNHYVVEPDNLVWNALEDNMEINECKFNIIKGVISSKDNKYKLEGSGYAKTSVIDNTYGVSQIETYEIPDAPFNTLIADCEGYLETFYNENKDFFKKINKIIMECDMPDKCNYQYLLNELFNIGFKVEEHVVEFGLNFYVLKK